MKTDPHKTANIRTTTSDTIDAIMKAQAQRGVEGELSRADVMMAAVEYIAQKFDPTGDQTDYDAACKGVTEVRRLMAHADYRRATLAMRKIAECGLVWGGADKAAEGVE